MFRTILAFLILLVVMSVGPAESSEPCQIGDKLALPDPSSVTMASSVSTYARNTMDLYQCLTDQVDLTCYLTYTRVNTGSADYTMTPSFMAQIRLFDNFKEVHKVVGAAFCDGRNRPVQTINLGQNDWVWIVLRFDGGATDITDARLLYPGDGGPLLEFRGPVNKQS